MGLGQGGGGHRRPEAGVEALDRPSEASLDLGARLLGGERVQPVPQAPEILGDLAAEDVGARRHHLAELDRHRPQPLEHPGHALAGTADPRLAAGEQAHEPAQHPRAGRQQQLHLARDQGVVARQHPPGADQSGEGPQIAHDREFRAPTRGAGPPRRR